ncbi:MAG: alpha/beta hydrolase [bacterium]|nr:alpha/beta hydrolase [bacterium]
MPIPLRLGCRLFSAIAPPLAAEAAAALFCRPHRKARPPAEERWLRSATPFRLRIGGRELAAWSWGSGPTVLLHHGWGGRGGQLGAFVDPLLEQGFSVVTYDAFAHGESPGRTNSLIEMAATLREASSQLDGLFGVVAHSLGGLATALALANGMRLERAVFICPPSDMLHYTDLFCRSLGFSPRVHDRMLQLYEERLQMRFHDLDGVALARRQRTPLLIFHDRDDRDVRADQVQRLHRAWPGSHLTETTGLGHRAIVREPAVVAAGVRFLDEGALSQLPLAAGM